MLVKLTPDQIASNWEFLKQNIFINSPLEVGIEVKSRLNNILQLLLVDELQCWAAVRKVELESKCDILGFALTQVLENNITGSKNLLLYSAVGFNDSFTINMWRSFLLTLVRYAKGQGCNTVFAYTNNQGLIDLAQKLHGDVSQRMVVFSLED